MTVSVANNVAIGETIIDFIIYTLHCIVYYNMLYCITYYILYFLVTSNNLKRDSTQAEKAIREEIHFRNLYLFHSIRLISSIFRSQKRNTVDF